MSFFSQALFGSSKKSTGIQITDSAIRYVSFTQKKQSLALSHFGEVFLSSGVVKSGKIINPARLEEALKTLRKKYDFRHVTVVLPEQQSWIFTTNIPPASSKEFPQMIEDHVMAQLQLRDNVSAKNLVCEYEILSSDNAQVSVQVTVTPRTIIDAYASVFEQAGYRVDIMEVGVHMISRACLADTSGSSCFLVDFGETMTHIATVANGKVVDRVTLSVGEKDLIRTIQDFLNISEAEAKKIHHKYGMLPTHKEPALLSRLVHAVSPIHDFINRSYVDWHRQEDSNHFPIHEIRVHGESAHLHGFMDHLAIATRIPVESAHPWHDIENSEHIPTIHQENLQRYVTVLSAGLRQRG